MLFGIAEYDRERERFILDSLIHLLGLEFLELER